MKIKAIEYFQDKFTGKYYKPGDVIDVESESRVNDLVNRKLVEFIEKKKSTSSDKVEKISLFDQPFDKEAVIGALKAIGIQATMNMKDETILGKANGLDEEKTIELKKHLGIE